MKEFRLALCDDEHFFIEKIISFLEQYEKENDCRILVTEYESGIELLKDIQAEGMIWDILFLDVDMPERSGTMVAKEIRKEYKDAVICYITSYEEFAYQAFLTEALGFLLKPVKYQELTRLLNRCILQVQYIKTAQTAKKRYIELKINHAVVLLCMEDIIYIEKRRNQCVFYLDEESRACYMTLAEAYELLDHTMFFYVHQGYIVNFNAIREVRKRKVYLGKDRTVPVSPRYAKQIQDMHKAKIKRLGLERRKKYDEDDFCEY